MMAYGPYGVQRHAGRYGALLSAAVLFFASTVPLAAQGRGGQTSGAQEPIDTAAILKIKDEGFNRSQVMDLMSWLTDVHGPRLTGSPITKRAGDWSIEQFKKWGLTNPRYEWWGPFGRGWVNDRTIAQVTAPVAFPVIGYPGAWSDGTNGPVSNEVVLVPNTVRTAAEFAPYRGKLKGKIVITQPARELAALFNAPGDRYTQEELDRLSNPFPVAAGGRGGGRGGRGGGRGGAQASPPPGGSPAVDL